MGQDISRKPFRKTFADIITNFGNPLQVWFQNARAKWRRNLMRQEGSNNNNIQNQAPNGPPSAGSVIMDANSMSHQSLDDLHHHLHSQNSQTLNFSDIY